MKTNNQQLAKIFMKQLKSIREQRDLTLDDLSEGNEFAKKKLEDLENFKELLDMEDTTYLSAIAKVYNIDWKQFSEYVYDEETKKWFYKVPILGKVQCGVPVYAQEHIEAYKLLPYEYQGKGNYFYLEAKGDSMIDLNIEEGDFLLIKKTRSLGKNEVGVIQVEKNGEAESTLKIYIPEKDKIILRSANDEYKDIEIIGSDMLGVTVCGRLEQVEKRDYTLDDIREIILR
ncbi:MAG: LexA family protein [Mycoplasmatales bacterium]